MDRVCGFAVSVSLFRNDDGATAILVALTMFLIVGVAAVAIDLSLGWNERRQDVTSVDLAAVAGALSFGSGETAMVDEVMNTARANLDTVFLDADWEVAWTSCVGPPPAGFTAATHSTLGAIDCIGLNPSFVWVRLPDQIVATAFGRVLGVDSLTTHAEAIVTLLGGGGAGSLPFVIRGDTTAGEVCLDTSTGSKVVPPCDGNESGSFGNIAPPLFGNESLNTSPSCGNQTSANNYVPQSIAMGMDHVIWKFTSAQWAATNWDPDDNTSKNSVDAVANMDECIDTGGFVAQAGDGNPINAVYVDTGNSTKTDITEGMMTGINFDDGDNARLTRSSNTRSVDGFGLDNNGLWKYLGLESAPLPIMNPEDNHGVPGCDGPTIRALLTIQEKNDAMRLCLENYESGGYTAQIFSDLMLESPRAGTAPRLWHNNLGSGLSYRPVKQFDVIYIHGMWFDDKGKTVFYPDDGISPITMNKMKEIEQITAYLLNPNMVSSSVHTSLGGFTNDTFQPEIYK